jgi:hypothetical protein
MDSLSFQNNFILALVAIFIPVLYVLIPGIVLAILLHLFLYRAVRVLELIPVAWILGLIYSFIIGIILNDVLILFVLVLSFPLASLIVILLKRKHIYVEKINKENLFHTLIIMVFVIFIFSLVFGINPGPRGDMWRHMGESFYFYFQGPSNYHRFYATFLYYVLIPIYKIISSSSYYMFLSFISLAILTFSAYAETFYLFAYRLLKNNRLAFVSTIIFLFAGGFDWVFLKEFSLLQIERIGHTFMSGFLYMNWSMGVDHILYVISSMCLLLIWVIVFSYPEQEGSHSRIVLPIALLIFVSYSSHVIEPVLTFGLFPILSLFCEESKNKFKQIILSYLLGLSSLTLISFFYGWPLAYYYEDTPLIPLVIVSLIIYISVYIFEKINFIQVTNIIKKFFKRFQKIRRKILTFFLSLFVGFYIVSLFFFFTAESLLYPYLYWQIVPVYLIPLKLGFIGIVIIIVLWVGGFDSLTKELYQTFKISAIAILYFIFLEELGGILGLRYFSNSWFIMWPYVAIYGGYSLWYIYLHLPYDFRIRKKARVPSIYRKIIVFLILLLSSLSTIIGLIFWSASPSPYEPLPPWAISLDEQKWLLLDILKNVTHNYCKTLVPADVFSKNIASLGGFRTPTPLTTKVFLSTQDPIVFFGILNSQNIGAVLSSNTTSLQASYLTYVLSLIGKRINIGEAKLYSLPEMAFPSVSSKLAFLVPPCLSTGSKELLAYLAISKLNYTTFLYFDKYLMKTSRVLVLGDDISLPHRISYARNALKEDKLIVNGSVITLLTNGLPDNHDIVFVLDIPVDSEHRYVRIDWKTIGKSIKYDGLYIILIGNMSGIHVIRLGSSDSWNITLIDLFDIPLRQGETLKKIIVRSYNDSYSIKNISFQSTCIGADLVDINTIINFIKNNNTVIIPYREKGYFSNLYKNLCAINDSNCAAIDNSVKVIKINSGHLFIIDPSINLSKFIFDNFKSVLQQNPADKNCNGPFLGQEEKTGNVSFRSLEISGDVNIFSNSLFFINETGDIEPLLSNDSFRFRGNITMLGFEGQYVKFVLSKPIMIVNDGYVKKFNVLIARSPIITVKGTLNVDTLSASALGTQLILLGSVNHTLIGSISLRVLASNSGYIMAKVLSFEGKIIPKGVVGEIENERYYKVYALYFNWINKNLLLVSCIFLFTFIISFIIYLRTKLLVGDEHGK